MKKINIIIIFIIYFISINSTAQSQNEFWQNYTYQDYPNATIIDAEFCEYSTLYFTVEAFEDNGQYYLCIRNVNSLLIPQLEHNYQIDDPLFDEILELTEFYYNTSEGVEYLVATGLMSTTSGERAFWAYFETNNYELQEIKVLDNDINFDPIEYAKGETSNVFRNNGDFALTGATGNNNAYILNLLNTPDASGIKLINDYTNDCAIYDVAQNPYDNQQYVFVGEYTNSSTAMTEVIVGRFDFDGQNFSNVSFGGIEFKIMNNLPCTELRARNICFGDNNKVYVAGDFTHGDYTSTNTTPICTQIYYLDFGVFDQNLFTTDFDFNTGERIIPQMAVTKLYRGVNDIINRGESKVPLIVCTSVGGYNSYNERFIYQIGDSFITFDEGGTLGTWYSDNDQLIITCNFYWKPMFNGITTYPTNYTCSEPISTNNPTIYYCKTLWTSEDYEDYYQQYSDINFISDNSKANLGFDCGTVGIIGNTFRKISIPNPNNDFSEIAINMYPNPATENFSVVVSEQSYEIKLYTNTGKLVAEYSDCLGETLIDVSNLPSAIYIAKIITPTEVFDKKIMIE